MIGREKEECWHVRRFTAAGFIPPPEGYDPNYYSANFYDLGICGNANRVSTCRFLGDGGESVYAASA